MTSHDVVINPFDFVVKIVAQAENKYVFILLLQVRGNNEKYNYVHVIHCDILMNST